jgi:hypothetical protein
MNQQDRERLRTALVGWLADAAIEAGGVDCIERGAIARRLQDQGLGRTAAYGWIAGAIADGDVQREAEARQAGIAALSAGLAASEPENGAGAELMPVTRHPGDVTAGPSAMMGAAIPLLQHLQGVIADAKRVREVALAPDGRVRNAKLFLNAAESLRRSLETAARLQATMNDLAALERFHRAIIDVIRQEDPAIAQRVMRRLDQLAALQLGEAA